MVDVVCFVHPNATKTQNCLPHFFEPINQHQSICLKMILLWHLLLWTHLHCSPEGEIQASSTPALTTLYTSLHLKDIISCSSTFNTVVSLILLSFLCMICLLLKCLSLQTLVQCKWTGNCVWLIWASVYTWLSVFCVDWTGRFPNT